MKKIMQLKNKLATLRTEAQNMLDAGNREEAKNKLTEIRDLQEEIAMQEELDEVEKADLGKIVEANEGKEVAGVENSIKKDANVIRALIKKATRKQLTEVENALLVPSTSNDDNGISYLLPVDVSNKIRERVREFKSLKDLVGYIPAGALTGSFPVEDFDTISELIDFTDGTELNEKDDIKFRSVPYSLKEKGAIISLSNTLLSMNDADLIDYIVGFFAKRLVVTENKMILTALKLNKTPKQLTTWGELRKSINVDLDPAMLYGTVIVTNQDGFEFLDSQEDKNGKPLLQEDISSPTGFRFKGYPIHKFSNATLETVEGKAPIFYGNLKEGVKLFDYKGLYNFATSSEAGFTKNLTLSRIITFLDVVQVDKSDKCYIYGELTIDAAETV